jgi:hypothetical protein
VRSSCNSGRPPRIIPRVDHDEGSDDELGHPCGIQCPTMPPC